jgi:hypothetical protein
MPWSSPADRSALVLFAGLSAAAATPTAEASAAQAGSPSAPLAGPRLVPEVPSIFERSATPSPAPPPPNTIVISTLALVLIAVIVTILIVE